MRLLVIVALAVSASAFAGEYVSKKVSFTIRSHTGGESNYYNCGYVENVVEGHLKALGVVGARANCHGGIESGWSAQAHVTVKFDAPLPTAGGAVEPLTLKGRFDNNCHLNTQVLNKILPELPAVTVVSKRDNCMSNSSRWSYDVTVAQ